MALTAPALDPDSAEWVRTLGSTGAEREAASARLHALLVPIARSAARRRGAALRIEGPELDDLAHQAAADALLAITGKLAQFRGDSRFTTWAYKFVIFEVSGKVAGHLWRTSGCSLDAEDGIGCPTASRSTRSESRSGTTSCSRCAGRLTTT